MMGKVLAVVSGKGGVGKTLISASIGLLLARQGKRVLLMDCDMGLRNLDLVFGMQDECFYHVLDFAEGKCLLPEAIISICKNLDFLPGSPTVTWNDIIPDVVETVLEDVDDKYDTIILDCPAGIEKGIHFAGQIADEVIIVMAPTWASIRNGSRLCSVLPKRQNYHYLFNQFTNTKEDTVSLAEALEMIDEETFGGVLPYSSEIKHLSGLGKLTELREDCIFSKSIHDSLRVILEDKIFPLERWILSLKKQNDLEQNKKESVTPVREKPMGLTWRSGSLAYKRRGRR